MIRPKAWIQETLPVRRVTALQLGEMHGVLEGRRACLGERLDGDGRLHMYNYSSLRALGTDRCFAV